MPADARGVKNHLRSAQRHRARPFRVPLIPADLYAHAAVLRVERRESEIAGREIKFLVVKRIVWNVHLAIFAEERSVGVNHRAGVVVKPRGAAFEEGSDDRDFAFARDGRQHIGRGPGKRLGKIEQVGVFAATEIFAVEQLVHADDLRAALRRFAYFLDRARQIVRCVLGRAHLNQADRKLVVHRRQSYHECRAPDSTSSRHTTPCRRAFRAESVSKQT